MERAGLLQLEEKTTWKHRFVGLGRIARHNPIGLIGAVGIFVLVVVAILAPVLAPFEPYAQITKRLSAPSGTYILGVDDLGRDVFSRLVYGARPSLYVGALSVSIAVAAGATSGLLAGFYRGTVDTVIMRVVDIMLAFPGLVLAIAITAFLGPSLTNAMFAIGIVMAPGMARIARAPVLSIVNEDYVLAARCLGVRNFRLLLRHVLPNAMAPLIVATSLSLSGAILAEASLSFLGLGTQPPDPSWGTMLSDARKYMAQAPWMSIYPGAAIMLSVLSFNLLGDGLRDVLDPRLRGSV